ncbi:MAG: ATP-binding protein, partial [Gammaproteobacteria bacterium]
EATASLAQCQRDEKELRDYQAELAELRDFAGFPVEKLGALRELKGKLESLTQHREAAEKRLRAEVEEPLRQAEGALRDAEAMAELTEEEMARASERQAVLADLWEQRREKRRGLRRERRRLRDSGADPDRAAKLAEAFAGLGEEDRRFLAGHRERTLELKASLVDAERQRERLLEAEGGESPALVSLAKARRLETLALVAGVAGLAAAILLFLSIQNRVPGVLVGVLSIASFSWWVWRHDKRPLLGAEEFGSDLQRVQTSLWALEKETAALAERLANLASRLDYPKPDQLLEEFKELQQLEDRAAPMTSLAAFLQEAQGRFASAASDLRQLMQRAGRTPAHGAVTPRSARRFVQDLTTCSRIRLEAVLLRTQRQEAELDLAATDQEIEALRSEATVALASGLAEAEPMADLAASLARFEEAASKRDRHDRLRDELLPAAERRNAVPPGERAAQLHVDIEVLSRQIDRAVRHDPGLRRLAPERSSREYAEERRRLQEEARATQRERLALSEELGDVLKEYRRDYPGRQTMLASLEAALARAVAFRDAVAVASEVLASISREAYAEWAEILNEKTSEILPRLVPGYENVRFDTDLSFSIRDSRTGRRLDRSAIDSHFSVGARDQIYLAVRMAVSDAMSTGFSPLPFILDDPLVNFDDRRFEMAMDFLMNTVAGRQQIILLSCHEERHRRWQERAAARTSDRVRLIDLTPLST